MMARQRFVFRVVIPAFAVTLGAAIARCQTFSIVHSFSAEHGLPVAGLVAGSDGRLYGTAPSGGPPGLGAVYALTPDGSGGFEYSNIHTFDLTSPEGNQPSAALIAGSDGYFYGTTSAPVPCGGSVFRIDSAGALSVLHSFSCDDGGYATARLLEGGDGFFYGVTTRQGGSGYGTLYRVDAEGNFNVLHSFSASEGYPVSGLTDGGDGFFYGTAGNLVYRADATGSVTVVHAFGFGEGRSPSGDLLLGTDGWLYGVTSAGGNGGEGDNGTAFRVRSDGTFQQLHSFFSDANNPTGGLIESGGFFYGTTSNGGSGGQGAVFEMTSSGTVILLHYFTGLEGASPAGSLLFGSDGVLYGICSAGGGPMGGTVFGLDPTLSLAVIHSFGSLEGNYPQGDLTVGADGALYGVTQNGGAWGFGTLFRFDAAGGFSVLHGFTRDEGTGGYTTRLTPVGQDLYGFLTGTAANPGGTFFRSDLSGTLTPVLELSGVGDAPSEAAMASDGFFYGASSHFILRLDDSGGLALPHTFDDSPFPYPNSAITQASDGYLYGTTRLGGAHQVGSIYRMSLAGDFQELYSFSGPDGSSPERQMRLGEGPDGALYGTTSEGGAFGYGNVFRFEPPGTVTSLHDFNIDDGALPLGSVVTLDDGRVCGTTIGGGPGGGGTVFCLAPDGEMSILHAFYGYSVVPTDGANPWAGLLLAPDGALYGTTQQGGVNRGGTLFRVEIPDFVKITTVTPGEGPAGGGTPFTISGVRFHDGAVVTIGGAAADGVVVSNSTTIQATSPALLPGTLNDVAVTNLDNGRATARHAWFVDFADVPPDNLYHSSIESIFRDGVTAGCGAGDYCPTAPVTRAEMAVFVLKGSLGAAYVPPPAMGGMFADVPADAFAAAWIENLAFRGFAAGCGNGDYCPDAPVTRAQMAVFLLKTLLGTSYAPPAATGDVFQDVPADAFAAAWIEDLARRGITGGCGGSMPHYCPANPVSRGQMAALLVKTFDLP